MPLNYLNLGLQRFVPSLKVKKEGGKEFIWDPSRQKYLVLQPEEFVRQLLMQYLRDSHQIPFSRMMTEQGIKLHNQSKRCDLIVYDKNGEPFLLAECKSYKINNPGMTLDQIERYNLEVNVDHVLITNGPESLFFRRRISDGRFIHEDEIVLPE